MWSPKRVSVNVWGVRGDDVYFEMLENPESVDKDAFCEGCWSVKDESAGREFTYLSVSASPP
jgi:hypothetical protein